MELKAKYIKEELTMKATTAMIIVIIQIMLIMISSCKQSTEPVVKPELKLELEDVSCTEAWIKLSANNLKLPAMVSLIKDGNVAQTISLWGGGDTTLYVDSLLPRRTYKFTALLQQPNNYPQPTTNYLQVTTMDTTSHNFTWQTWTFGTIGSSALYDVAIIDENDIWAVGEINIADTSINGYTTYNAVHWDGTKWELKRIPSIICGSNSIIYSAIYSIYVFNKNDIFFSDGAEIIHFNGEVYRQDCTINSLLTGKINKLWGSSSKDLYAVGNNGNIAHWDGRKWTKIESGTTSIINDVWGIKNSYSNIILYCPVSSFFVAGDKKILKIIDGKVDSVLWNRDVRLYSGWTMNEKFLYVCGEGVFVNKFSTWSEINLQQVGTNSIRGNNLNDIFIAGDYGFKSHFNGLTWQVYNNNYLKGYSRLSFQGNIVAIAGNYQGKAIVEIGRRN